MKLPRRPPLNMNGWQPPRQQTPAQAWMLTFADLTSLLLCFFVLFYATLTIDETRWQTLVGSFTASFAPRSLVVSATPSGQPNALPVVSTRRSVNYLDSILRQRLAADGAWAGLIGTEDPAHNLMSYTLAPELTNPANPATQAAWQRLGTVLFHWQTPVAVRVVVPPSGDWQAATQLAWELAELARKGGGRVTAEVERGTIAQTQWIMYGAE